MAATFALGVYSTKAAVGVTTNYSRLTVSATIMTNGTWTGTTTEKHPIGTTKISNKDLLKFMADWNSTTWPVGAQLEFDWESDEVIVADKTGTNILFYAGEGVDNGTIVAHLDIEWDNSSGVYNETYVNKDPGSLTWTESYIGYFQLYYDNVDDSSGYVNLHGYGPDAQKFSQKWDANGTYTTWTDSESFKVNGSGDVNDEFAIFGGAATASGKGKGYNPFWYN